MSVNIYDKQGDKLTQVAGNTTGGGSINIDNALSSTSANPVQNQVITNAINTLNSDLETHKIDTDIHVTAMEKSAWNNKAELTDIPTSLPANGGDADTVGGKHESDFMQNLGVLSTGSLLDYVLTMTKSGSLFITNTVTDTPISGLYYGVDVIRYSDGSYVVTATRFNGGGVWTNRYNSGAKIWYGWANVADGGNADKVDGKHAVDIMNMGNFAVNRTIIEENTDLDTMRVGGKYVVNSKTIAESCNNTPFTETGYYFDVVRHSSGNILQIATLWTGKTKIRNSKDEISWNEWVNIADGGNAATVNGLTVQTAVPANAKFTDTTYGAATESVSGLVSTTTQNFAGNKFVQAERVGIRMMGVTKGTIPTSSQIAQIQFQDNSGSNGNSASLGQIYHQVQNNTGNSILTLQAVEATTSGSTNRTALSVMYGPHAKCTYVSVPIVDDNIFCLRNMQSGTLEPVATATSGKITVQSGAWYGKHS